MSDCGSNNYLEQFFEEVNANLHEMYGSAIPYKSPREKLMEFIRDILPELMENDEAFFDLNKKLIKKYPNLNLGMCRDVQLGEIIAMVKRFVLLVEENDYNSLETFKAGTYLMFMSRDVELEK